MNILMINQFYPPDIAPTGRFLHDLAKQFVHNGHTVHVIASSRSYEGETRFLSEEIIDGVYIRRIPAFGFGRKSYLGKIMDYLSFCLIAPFFLMASKPHPHLLVSLTTPPYIGVFAKWVAAFRKTLHVQWLMDLYPDVMVSKGMLKNHIASNLLHKLAVYERSNSSLILTIAEEMTRKVMSSLPSSTQTNISIMDIPLWSPFETSDYLGSDNLLRRARGWQQSELVLMYSGNMGLGHRFGEFLTAATRLIDDQSIRWVFSGGGKNRCQIEKFIQTHHHLRMELMDYVPFNQLKDHLQSADVHLMSFDSQWQGNMLPSKLAGIFSAGRAVIYVGGCDNSIYKWINEAEAGWTIKENDLDGLLQAIQEAKNPVLLHKKCERAIEFARYQFNKTKSLETISSQIEGMTGTHQNEIEKEKSTIFPGLNSEGDLGITKEVNNDRARNTSRT